MNFSVDEEVERQFRIWVAEHDHDEREDLALQMWRDCWRVAAWDTLQRNATLGLNLTQITQRLEELAALYRGGLPEERASVYWKAP